MFYAKYDQTKMLLTVAINAQTLKLDKGRQVIYIYHNTFPAFVNFSGIVDQFEAMNDELERRREECLQLRAMMAEKSITTHAIAKESYGGNDNIVNEDNELAMAYRTQKELNRYVHVYHVFINLYNINILFLKPV